MTSKRPYREPMPRDEALDLIRQGSGGHFDPDVVEQFVGLVTEGPALAAGPLGQD